MELALEAATYGNLNAISDAATGVAMAQAALHGAGWNVQVNLTSLPDHPSAAAMKTELAVLRDQSARIDMNIKKVMQTRGGII